MRRATVRELRRRLALALCELGRVPDPRIAVRGVTVDQIEKVDRPFAGEARGMTTREVDAVLLAAGIDEA